RHLRRRFPRMGVRRRPQKQRIQVFDQNGNFIVEWKQFGQPSSVFVGKDDTIYVGASFPDASAKKGEMRGIVIGNAIDGSLKAFIPDPADLDKVIAGTSASGIAADSMGSVFAADVGHTIYESTSRSSSR